MATLSLILYLTSEILTFAFVGKPLIKIQSFNSKKVSSLNGIIGSIKR